MGADNTWEELRRQHERPIFRRVNDAHPHDIYLGLDANDAPVVMLLSSISAPELPRLKCLAVSQNLRHDGKFALIVSLANAELLHPFRYVCDDLIESLRQHPSPESAAAFMLHRLEKWRRLLEVSRKGLSEAEIHGLIGELLFLEKLASKIGPAAAIEAWLGPSGAPQDFQSGGQIYEIKACAIGGHTVVISSLEQLNTGTTPASLIVYSVGSSSADAAGALSLNQLITRVRALLEGTSAYSTFELRLAELGYDQAQTEADSPLLVQNVRAFAIGDGFPRLIPSAVPSAIASATYCLDLDQCTQFEIPNSEVPGV